ncbi:MULTISPECIES: tRNA (guanine(46)-N(7))-methyltransferase TrmB [unclassified Alteromonas]|jgi:tRNA (guanine-N7-)-methyltransferase|uniref:tRNA (guanine(46)-N(7))-methyltransferase TrmB n=1 Tax=unclassified Alteromonas TaxID=2614992 RepID=UPI0005094B93|nr:MULTISPECIES: SAM-dependent methyltransferase [unclassified Alteromonas]
MSDGNSRSITTNQVGVHDKLDELVLKYQSSVNKRPVGEHTQAAFDEVSLWLGGFTGPVILDSCCGVGESTATIAKAHPEARVIGVDKSAQRVEKHSHYQIEQDNYCVIRADVNDFWRLVRQSNWQVVKHYLLYPNPYPKKTQVQKRWHGSAAMVDLMAITTNIEVRSNWLIYLMEFAQAAKHYGSICDLSEVKGANAMTPFERKYSGSGQTCWKLNCRNEES